MCSVHQNDQALGAKAGPFRSLNSQLFERYDAYFFSLTILHFRPNFVRSFPDYLLKPNNQTKTMKTHYVALRQRSRHFHGSSPRQRSQSVRAGATSTKLGISHSQSNGRPRARRQIRPETKASRRPWISLGSVSFPPC